MTEIMRRWRVRQGTSTAFINAPDHAAALIRGGEIGFSAPDSVALVEPLYRISYMHCGQSRETGYYHDRAKCEIALTSFQRTGRAWMQESQDLGRTWRPVESPLTHTLRAGWGYDNAEGQFRRATADIAVRLSPHEHAKPHSVIAYTATGERLHVQKKALIEGIAP